MIEGKKESKGKLDWSCLPMESLTGVIKVFEKGFAKYKGKNTWQPGIRFSKLFSATMRHLIDWFYFHKDKDAESGEHPLCHVIANCLILLTYIKNVAYDDRSLIKNKTFKKVKNEISKEPVSFVDYNSAHELSKLYEGDQK